MARITLTPVGQDQPLTVPGGQAGGQAEEQAPTPTTGRGRIRLTPVGDASPAPQGDRPTIPARASSGGGSGESPLGDFAKGLVHGGTQGSGAMMGAAAGGVLGLATGPAAPVAFPVLSAAGYMIGNWAGSEAAGGLVGEESDAEKPLFHGGKVFGEIMGGVGSLPSIARRVQGALPDNWAGRFLTGLVDEAARGLTVSKKVPDIVGKKLGVSEVQLPTRFTLGETLAGGGAAIGATTAETLDPGDTTTRLLAEIGGGLAATQGNLTYIGSKVARRLTDFLKKQSTAGRRDVAADVLNRYVNDADEDPETVLELVRRGKAADEVAGEGLGPASTVASSPALQRLEADLGQHSPEFMANLTTQRRESLQTIGKAIAMLRGSGSPEALQTAVQMRYDMQEELIEGYLESARNRAADSARAMGGEDLVDAKGNIIPRKLQDMSTTVKESIDTHFAKLRETEEHLWTKAFEGKEAEQAVRKHMSIAYNDIRANRVASEMDIPATVSRRIAEVRDAEDVLRRANGEGNIDDGEFPPTAQEIAKAQDTLSVKRLMLTRSQLLADVRAALRKGDDNQAEIIGRMVDGVTEDLFQAGQVTKTRSVTYEGGRVVDVPVQASGRFAATTPVDQALAFTRAFKEVSARTFAGATREKDLTGALKMQPEMILRRSLASGQELGDLRMRQIREFLKFTPEQVGIMADEGFMDGGEALANVVSAQTNALRAAAYEAIGPDGQISVARMRSFLNRHRDSLADFPEVTEEISKALSSRESLKRFEARAKNFRKVRNQRFAKALGYDNVQGALLSAFSSRVNAVTQLDEIHKAAVKGGEEAMESMRYSMWDIVFARSKGPAGTYDTETFIRTLDSPISPGAPTLREYMTERNLMPPDVSSKLDELTAYANRILKAQGVQGGADPIPKPGILESMFVSIFGAEAAKRGFQAAQKIAGGSHTRVSSGPTLVLAHRGANALRSWLIKTPNAQLRVILQDALAGAPIREGAEPYSLLETLLEGPQSVRHAIRQTQRVNIYMWNAGLHSLENMSVDFASSIDTIPEQGVSESDTGSTP